MENVDEVHMKSENPDTQIIESEKQFINWTPILITLAFLIVFTVIIMNPMGIQFHKIMYGNSFGVSDFSYRPPAAALMSA